MDSRSQEPNCDHMSTGCNSQPIYNPFEVDICSLSLPACSPDAFSLTNKKPLQEDNNPDESFRWSIGQVAVLKPAKIDEQSQQSVVDRWDEEKECRAQKAIQTFFLHNSVCPSPWNGAMNFKHVSFSPNLASTAYFSRSNSPFNVNGESSELPGKKNVWTQTTLAIPTEIDIFQLLGQFYTFLEDQRAQTFHDETDFVTDTKDFGNSSLRRKLFSPNRCQQEPSNECGPAPLAISPLKFCTPEKIPLCKSPSSAGTHFSSSPISGQKCSISPCQMEYMYNLTVPSVSPILKEKQRSEIKEKFVDSQGRWLPSTPCTKKGVRLKSQMPSGLNSGKELLPTFSISMSSKAGTEDLQMESDQTRYDSTQNSEMQVSVVQFSAEEKTSTQSTGASALHPSSVLSQDTGYKTESYQYSLDNGTCANINESKEKMVHNWLTRDYDVENGIVDTFQSCRAPVVEYTDSSVMSQSNWHPQEFSTPH